MSKTIQIFYLLSFLFVLKGAVAGETVIIRDAGTCGQLQKVLPFQNGFVASNDQGEILLISLEGKIINQTGGYGSGKESFGNLADICTFRDLNIYAVDLDRARIVSFDYNLNLVGVLENNVNWPENVQFTQPSALQIAQTGEWFLVDRYDPRLINIDLRGNPQWAYRYPLGGAQKYWQDIRILQINTEKRMLYLYDHFYQTVFILDYWGNLIDERKTGRDIESLVFWRKEAFYLLDNHVYNLVKPGEKNNLDTAIAAIPGHIKFIAVVQNRLLVLTDSILVLLDV